MKIGVVGFSSNRINEIEACDLLQTAIDQLVAASPSPSAVEIVTGLTINPAIK